MGMLNDVPAEQNQPAQTGQTEESPVRDPAQAQSNPQAQDVEALKQQGVKLLYDDRFDALMKMFKANGAERFPQSMATAINTVIGELEKQGPIPLEIITEVAMELFTNLFSDIVDSDEVPGITEKQAQGALNETIKMYAKSHPDTVSDEDLQALVAEIQNQTGGAGMQPEQSQSPPGGMAPQAQPMQENPNGVA